VSQKHLNTYEEINGETFFKKVFFDKFLFEKEKAGYYIVSKYYPTPKLVNISDKHKSLTYELEKSVLNGKGLLFDVFNGREDYKSIDTIIEVFKEVFFKTISKKKSDSHDVFFKDRVSRLKNNYFSVDEEYCVDLESTILCVEDFFKNEGETWTIVSQCDPSDLNIGVKPIIFDFLAGGHNPLIAEYASLVWEQFMQSEVLAPIYNSDSYKKHSILNEVDLRNGSTFRVRPERLEFLKKYTLNIIKPLVDQVEYTDWYSDFKNYIAMRILTVFNLMEVEQIHKNIAFNALDLIYNQWNPENPGNLVELISKYEFKC